MALGDIKQGYMGFLSKGSDKVRCTSFSIQPVQNALFYDHTKGLRDGSVNNIFDQKSEQGAINSQKIFMRPGVKIYQGNISFPATENSSSVFFDEAKYGGSFDNLTFRYTCGIARKMDRCRVNGYTFNAVAGDLVNISVDIIAASMEDVTSDDIYDLEEKLITWDDISTSLGDSINGISFSVNNNCSPIYTAGNNAENGLNPYKIRVGMQEVTGFISYYNKGVDLSFLESSDKESLSISMDDFSVNLNVVFRPQEREGSVGPIISSRPFVGVERALGT